MQVRAKFICGSITKTTGGDTEHPFLYAYKFSPVVSGSEENKKFWRWTPCGSVDMTTCLVDAFEVGKAYYLDFSEAE